jgi:hypothetical protein
MPWKTLAIMDDIEALVVTDGQFDPGHAFQSVCAGLINLL